MKKILGTCLCGSVAFEVIESPFVFLYCHCRSCQKSSGSIHAANLGFPEDPVRWIRGEHLIQLFVETVENPGFPRVFCRTCGSPVPKLSRNRKFWVVPSGSLDSDPEMRPQANIYWSEHAPWFASGDQIPKHDTSLPQQATANDRKADSQIRKCRGLQRAGQFVVIPPSRAIVRRLHGHDG